MLGIALEGGGARCAAQAGALSALADKGFTPDVLAGCGGGAWVAAMFALGMRGDTLLKQIKTMGKEAPEMLGVRRSAFKGFMSGSLQGGGMLSESRLSTVLRWQTMDVNLPDVKMPLAIAVWDVEAGEEWMLSSKLPMSSSTLCWNRQASLSQAIAASMCVPGIFPPIAWRGRTLTGGGVLWRTLPEALRDLGADNIIRLRVMSARDATVDAIALAQSARLPTDILVSDDVVRIELPNRAGLADFKYVEAYFEIGYRSCNDAILKLSKATAKVGGNILPFKRNVKEEVLLT